MYPLALDCGVPVDLYWNLTLQEIVDIIESETRRRREEIGRLFVLADAISSRVAYFFSDPKKRRESDIVQPWDSYPSLFETAKEAHEDRKEQRQDAELEAYKARMATAIEAWNKRFEEGKQ